jgi:hypothetical protein
MPEHEVSHGDIYHKLGALEGKLDAIVVSVAEKRTDLADAFKRLVEVEKRVAQGVILAVVIGFVAPILWSAVGARLHFGGPPAEASSHDSRTGTAP